MPELVLKLGDNVLQTYVFDKDVMSIGRSRDNDVVVENLSVSRNHARVRRQNGKYILTDLNSANGTYVNGVRVSKTEIVNEDIISIGKHKLFFNDQPVNEEKMIADAFGADRTVVVDRAPAPVLCISDGKLKGQEFNITKFETSIGKAPSNDVVLSDDWFLAKKQAVIIRRGNHDYEIHDMGGFKRTKVNGVQINEPKALQPGDVLEFGNTRCVFQMAGDVAAPSGRVPQEMALDDSIFSSGVNYSEPEEAPQAHGIETPFVASAEAAPIENEYEVEPALDPSEMAREAIEADERARAEARHAMAEPATARSNGKEEDLDSARENKFVNEDSMDVLSLDEDYASSQSTYSEPQPAENEEQEAPAPVYAGIGEEVQEQASSAAAIGGVEAPFAPAGIPITPALPMAESSSEPVVSASGGRSNRKKKRERQGNGGDAASAPPAIQERDSVEPAPREQSEDPIDLPAEPQAEVASQASVASAAAPATRQPSHALAGGNDEIALWEAALQNKSIVIRKQAAKMLRKLTGKDYEV